jgi:hypothetical protein
VWERRHVQEWVRKHPEILGEDLLVVSMEFDRFEGSRDRLYFSPSTVAAT